MQTLAVQMASSREPNIEELSQFQNYVYFGSVDPVQNRYRFCTLSWQHNLWGGVTLVRTWGRIGGRGRSCSHTLDEREVGSEIAARLIARRLRRGYTVTDWQ